jgi:hypothetical protein
MLRKYVILILLPYWSAAQVAIGSSSPDASAKFQIDASATGNAKGFLPPRVQLSAINNVAPFSVTPATGLLVYNTFSAGTYPNNVTPGYYYYEGSRWMRVSNGQSAEVPAWNDAGTISFGATTTAPTVGTTTRNSMFYRQLGTKEWEVALSFNTTGASAAAGSGDYLFTLPNGLSFDLTLPWQSVYTANNAAFSTEFHRNAIPMSSGFLSSSSNGYISTGTFVVPYSATKFRIMIYVHGSSGTAPWGAGWFPLTFNQGGNWTFRFTSQ